MKDLTSVSRAITHSTRFHFDDTMCTAFVKDFNPNIDIVRLPEYKGEGGFDEIVYDIGMGRFDHHQANRKIDDFGVPYCAFGLLWEEYGRLYLQNKGVKNVEKAFNLFKSEYVCKMDYGDNNGYSSIDSFGENDLIIQCNLLWYESTPEIERKMFDRAVEMSTMILENWLRLVRNEVDEPQGEKG